MSQEKYIGLDVHPATISAAVMDAHGCHSPIVTNRSFGRVLITRLRNDSGWVPNPSTDRRD